MKKHRLKFLWLSEVNWKKTGDCNFRDIVLLVLVEIEESMENPNFRILKLLERQGRIYFLYDEIIPAE